jgi:hypothetical protein
MEQLKDTLTKFGYEGKKAEITASALQKLTGDLGQALKTFINTGVEPTGTAVNGYSYEQLKNEFGMNFFAALLTLDWIRRSPDDAIKALKSGIK